eukprot:3114386-Amphidinium_carterae.1
MKCEGHSSNTLQPLAQKSALFLSLLLTHTTEVDPKLDEISRDQKSKLALNCNSLRSHHIASDSATRHFDPRK